LKFDRILKSRRKNWTYANQVTGFELANDRGPENVELSATNQNEYASSTAQAAKFAYRGNLTNMFVPDQNMFDSLPITLHSSEQDAAIALQTLGQMGTAPNPQWVFRGQVSRQPKRKWPPVDQPTVRKHAFEMEQLLPSDYRQLESRLEKGESKASLKPIFGDQISGIGPVLTTYLMQCHTCWGDNAVQTWFAGLSGLSGSAEADKLLSIGQHYGLRTHLMDWSSDWEVAMWFASHQWASGDYEQGGDGVIYQLEVLRLVKAEDNANLADPNLKCRHVDIRNTPALLAPRALAQRGFSVAEIESPCFLQELITQKALVAHIFPRGRAACAINSLTKAQLVPPFDEMSNLFEDARKGGHLFQQAIGWIQTNYPSLSPTVHDLRHIFA
jgi:hypothetical protein